MASAFLHDNENNKTGNFCPSGWSSSLCLSSQAHSPSCAEPLPTPPPGGSLYSPSPCQPRPSYNHHQQVVLLGFTSQYMVLGKDSYRGTLLYSASPSSVLVIPIIQHTLQCGSCGLDGSSLWKCKVIGLGLDLARWWQWDCTGASQRWTPCWFPEKL